MKSLRPLGVFVALLAVGVFAVVAVKRTGLFGQGVGEVSEIAPNQGSLEKPPPIDIGTGNWPWWRGGQHNGSSAGKAVTKWSENRNIAWKSPVPGSGHASPVVFADRIFLATADEQEQTQSLVCFDRQTGRQLWCKVIHTGGFMHKHPKNTHASATPACDGKRVFVPFLHASGLWVTSVDFDGIIAWQTEVGPFVSEHGYGGSPVLCDSYVIVNGDSRGGGFLAALHRTTGEVVWRKQRPNNSGHGSYGSPILAQTAGKRQLIQHGAGTICSYHPATGELLWRRDGPAQVAGNTPAFDDNHVIASGGYPEKAVICVRADGKGDVTATHVIWCLCKGVAYASSPLIADGLAYLVQEGQGVLTCFEVASGKQVWKERLRGEFSASPVLADGILYLANESGETFVLKAGREFKLVATNQLDEGALATPAIGAGWIYLRTAHHLYCIGARTRE